LSGKVNCPCASVTGAFGEANGGVAEIRAGCTPYLAAEAGTLPPQLAG
jgi:hypothetical protein